MVLPRPTPVDDLGDAAKLWATHTSVRVLLTQGVIFLLARPFLGRPGRRDVTIVAAVFAWWPFQEWLAHKYVLHAKPAEFAGRTWDPAVARYHREHHADPWRIDLSFLPAWFILPMVPLNVVVWWFLAGRRRGPAVTGMLASTVATLGYEWTHFLTHTSHKPRSKWYRTLQRRHRLHHFKDEHLWYGFTVPYVDDLLGTAPDPSTVATSPTVRTLGVDVA